MLLTLLDLSDTSIHIIYDALFGMKDLLQCRNFNPIYTTLVYDGEFAIFVLTRFILCLTSLNVGCFFFFLVSGSCVCKWSRWIVMGFLHFTQHGRLQHDNDNVACGDL